MVSRLGQFTSEKLFMKAKKLLLLAGISAPLIASTAADAGFVGINVVQKDDTSGLGLLVVNVYAEFTDPLRAVKATAARKAIAPLSA